MNKIELTVDGEVTMRFAPHSDLQFIWDCLEATPDNSDARILVNGTQQAFRYGCDCWRSGTRNNNDLFAPLWEK